MLFYQSSDATISITDTTVGTETSIPNLSENETDSQMADLLAPSSSGTYYYGACVGFVAEEVNRTNNCSTGVKITVSESDDEIPSPPPSGDHGDTTEEATVVTSGSNTPGELTANDIDYFTITVTGAGTLRAFTTGSTDTLGTIERKAGTNAVQIMGTDDNSGTDSNFDISETRSSTFSASDTYYIKVEGATSSTTGPYSLEVTFTPTSDETPPPPPSDDHGNTRDEATVITAGSTTSGFLATRDNDYFTITIDKTGILRAYTTGTTDTRGTIEDSDGNVLTFNHDGGSGNNFDVSYKILSIGTYYINVDSFFSSTTGAYDLMVSFTSDDHGDTRETATVITAGSNTPGVLTSGDDDYFAITVDETGILRAYTTGTTDTLGTIEDQRRQCTSNQQ